MTDIARCIVLLVVAGLIAASIAATLAIVGLRRLLRTALPTGG